MAQVSYSSPGNQGDNNDDNGQNEKQKQKQLQQQQRRLETEESIRSRKKLWNPIIPAVLLFAGLMFSWVMFILGVIYGLRLQNLALEPYDPPNNRPSDSAAGILLITFGTFMSPFYIPYFLKLLSGLGVVLRAGGHKLPIGEPAKKHVVLVFGL